LRGLTILHVVGFALAARWLRTAGAITTAGLAAAIAPPVVGALTGIVLCEIARRAIGLEIDGFWAGMAYGSLFALFYLAFLRLLFGAQLRELVSYFPRGDRLNRLLGFRAVPAVSPEPA
jgi:hypothetical protein